MEEGKIEINNQYESLKTIIELVAKLNAPNAEKKGISLTTEFDASFPSKMALDKTRITQVIMNLATNAIKFTPQDGNVVIKAHFTQNKSVKQGFCWETEKSLCVIPLLTPKKQIQIQVNEKVFAFINF